MPCSELLSNTPPPLSASRPPRPSSPLSPALPGHFDSRAHISQVWPENPRLPPVTHGPGTRPHPPQEPPPRAASRRPRARDPVIPGPVARPGLCPGASLNVGLRERLQEEEGGRGGHLSWQLPGVRGPAVRPRPACSSGPSAAMTPQGQALQGKGVRGGPPKVGQPRAAPLPPHEVGQLAGARQQQTPVLPAGGWPRAGPRTAGMAAARQVTQPVRGAVWVRAPPGLAPQLCCSRCASNPSLRPGPSSEPHKAQRVRVSSWAQAPSQ